MTEASQLRIEAAHKKIADFARAILATTFAAFACCAHAEPPSFPDVDLRTSFEGYFDQKKLSGIIRSTAEAASKAKISPTEDTLRKSEDGIYQEWGKSGRDSSFRRRLQ